MNISYNSVTDRKIVAFLVTLIVGTLIYPISLNAQTKTELSEEFLEGLPPSVRQSLEAQNSAEERDNLEKLLKSETTTETNKALLKKLKDQLAILEQSIDEDSNNTNEDFLERFGSNFFRTVYSSFMPVNAPNIGADYILDVGDSLLLLLTGKTSSSASLVIQRDGSISIEGIGKIYLAGKSLSEAEKYITSFVETASFGTNAFISLDQMRDVQVLLLGGVQRPGIYTLNGGASLLGAIDAAGGISENGSYRSIEFRRNSEIIKNFDLYDIFVDGNYQPLHTLRSGDIIFVNPVRFQVPVSGGVNFPAIFEPKPGEKIQDLIEYAGGFSADFSGYKEVILKRSGPKSQSIQSISLDQLTKISLMPRDAIKVPSYKNLYEPIKKVSIAGMVNRPGEYFVEDNEKLSDLIERAGGYKKNAYIFGAALFREEALIKEELYAQLNYSDTVNYIVSSIGKSAGANIGAGSLNLLVEELRSRQQNGRIVVDFNLNELSANPSKNITLSNNDQIIIPEMQKVIYMFGAFKNPSNYTYDSNLSINNYINSAGGLKESAYKEILVIDPDGNTQLYNHRSLFAMRQVDLYPGSIIYAPRDVGKLSGLSYAATISPVLSGLALTLASFNSIKD